MSSTRPNLTRTDPTPGHLTFAQQALESLLSAAFTIQEHNKKRKLEQPDYEPELIPNLALIEAKSEPVCRHCGAAKPTEESRCANCGEDEFRPGERLQRNWASMWLMSQEKYLQPQAPDVIENDRVDRIRSTFDRTNEGSALDIKGVGQTPSGTDSQFPAVRRPQPLTGDDLPTPDFRANSVASQESWQIAIQKEKRRNLLNVSHKASESKIGELTSDKSSSDDAQIDQSFSRKSPLSELKVDQSDLSQSLLDELSTMSSDEQSELEKRWSGRTNYQISTAAIAIPTDTNRESISDEGVNTKGLTEDGLNEDALTESELAEQPPIEERAIEPGASKKSMSDKAASHSSNMEALTLADFEQRSFPLEYSLSERKVVLGRPAMQDYTGVDSAPLSITEDPSLEIVPDRPLKSGGESTETNPPDPGHLRLRVRFRRADLYLGLAVFVAVAALLWPAATAPHPPTLSLWDRALVAIGIAEAPTPVVHPQGDPTIQVWVDPHTALYYCPGEEPYGKTASGRLSSQRDAQLDQFQPASRSACE